MHIIRIYCLFPVQWSNLFFICYHAHSQRSILLDAKRYNHESNHFRFAHIYWLDIITASKSISCLIMVSKVFYQYSCTLGVRLCDFRQYWHRNVTDSNMRTFSFFLTYSRIFVVCKHAWCDNNIFKYILMRVTLNWCHVTIYCYLLYTLSTILVWRRQIYCDWEVYVRIYSYTEKGF